MSFTDETLSGQQSLRNNFSAVIMNIISKSALLGITTKKGGCLFEKMRFTVMQDTAVKSIGTVNFPSF